MARITGPDTVKDKAQAQYTLQSDEAIDEKSIVWSVSTVVSKRPYEKKDYGKKTIVIDFKNPNESNLNVSIKVEYKLKNGTKGASPEKKVTLLGKTADKTPPKTPQEARPDTGNKSAVINTVDTGKQQTKEKEITLKIHVYFDGTFGNKENIRAMEIARNKNLTETKPDIHDDKYKKGNSVDHDQYEKDLKAYQKKVKDNKDSISRDIDQPNAVGRVADIMNSENKTGGIGKAIGYYIGADPTSDMNSYTQVYTNIPIIFDMEESEAETDEKSREKTIKVYIEGVGTQNLKGDDFMALATGSDSGGAGIPSKVKRAFEDIEKEAKEQRIKANNIKKVEICVMGFSRGAATTRNFVAERETMLSTLKKINSSIKDDIITYKFVGIFDTVCSVTDFTKWPKIRPDTVSGSTMDSYITSLQKNNIKDYKLAMGGNVKEIVHLVAADEHRLFFPLTTINTSIDAGCGFELVLPGSHCDLGGGDPDVLEEAFTEVIMKGDKDPSLAEYLIKNNWYDKTEPSTLYESQQVHVPVNFGPWQGTANGWMNVPVGKQYNLKRKVIVGYNRIPLAIMLHFAAKFGEIALKDKDESDRTKIHDELVPVKNKLLNYAKNNHRHGRSDNLVGIFNREFGHLRKKYLHLSAVLDFARDVSENISNAAEIKDIARLNSKNEPNRAILSDRTDWEEVSKYISDTVEEAVDAAKEKVEEAKEKIGDTIDDAVEGAIDAGKEAVKKGAKKIIEGITDNFGRPILK